jgi:sphinganine-1-phosphate aldolase
MFHICQDAHKFGYACKGISVVLYRNEDLRHAQYFSYAKWSGGLYATPTIAGSRPGSLVACAWAALVSMGESGYMQNVEAILKASHVISDEISKISGIRVLGTQAPTMIVCFDSVAMDIYRVGSKMSSRGWDLNSLQNPPCLHICVTMNTIPYIQDFINDLGDSVAEVRKEGPAAKKSGPAAIYGMAGGLPAGPVDELMKSFIDELLKV